MIFLSLLWRTRLGTALATEILTKGQGYLSVMLTLIVPLILTLALNIALTLILTLTLTLTLNLNGGPG